MGIVIGISNQKIYFLIKIGVPKLLILVLVAQIMEISGELSVELRLIPLHKFLKDKHMMPN